MLKFLPKVVTTVLIFLIQFGILLSISAVQVEKSKELTYLEWLEQQQENEQSTSQESGKSETAQQAGEKTHHIQQDSWADFHRSQTAKNTVVRAESVYKLIKEQADIFIVNLYGSSLDKPTFEFVVKLIQSFSIAPFLSGVAIGAP